METQMLTYNSSLKPLILPEYGRSIQDMLDHCLTIDDRAERTRCARSIIDAMAILFPSSIDQHQYRRKLWDHLAIMSDFKLDVDLPFEITKPEGYDMRPEPVALGSGQARRKVYGCHLELMVEEAAKMEPGEERDRLVELLANQMKKAQLAVNPDGVDDGRIFRDLFEMTDGAISLSPDTMRLAEYKLAPQPGKKKKKK